MNLYTDLAYAKDELRRAKDHEQTIRAIVEGPAQIFGKSADDRKRELAFLLAKDVLYKKSLEELRYAEYAVDQAQAAIDQAESERREHEWAIRSRLAEALEKLHLSKSADDIDWHDLHFQTEQRKFDAVQTQHECDLRSPTAQAKARAEMDELFAK